MNETRRLSVAGAEGGFVAVPESALEYLYQEQQASEAGRGLDLRALSASIYRNRWIILGIVVACMAAGLARALLTAPVYRATATIQIDQQTAKVLEGQDEEPVVTGAEADRFLQTQVDVIRSRGLAVRVSDTLRLPAIPTFAPAKAGTPEATEPGERKRHVVDALMDDLSVDLPRNSRVVKINFENGDPALAARIANSFAENAITSNLQRKFDTSSYSRQFLEEQLAKAKVRLEESERAVVSYARAVGLIDASSGMATGAMGSSAGPQSITTSSLVQINQSYSQAKANRVQAEQRWRSAQATPALNLPEVLGNPTIQQLTQKKAELQAELSEEQERRKEGHPSVIQAEARIAEIDRQIGALANSIKSSIREQFTVALRQEEGLSGSVGQLKGATLAEQDRSVRYNILKREADTNRQMYDGLLQRFRELSAAAGITSNNISIIDRADAPRIPVWPKPLLNLAVGALAGLLLAMVIVFLREKFDDAIRTPDDVEGKLGLPLLGTVPLLKKESPLEALENPRSLVSEAHYALRMSLELASDQGLPPAILLTSTRPSEGKSTSAYAIARDLALAGKRVLLVDADLRKPSLHRVLGLDNRLGLSNLLARQKNLDEVVQGTPVPDLFFVSSGPLPPNPAQLLAGAPVSALLAKLKQIFDVVVIDGPPVLGLADAPRLADMVDATIFVVQANGAHHGHAKAALKRLLAGRAKILGVVLTKFDAKKAGYKSDYGYYYYEYGGSSPQLEAPRAA